MKKTFSVFLVIVAVMLFPIWLPGKNGAYNKASGFFWCSSNSSCTHEVAHKIDDEAGWISHSDEFYLTVKSLSPNAERGFLNRNMEEIYATIFERSLGDSEAMPEQFRKFYDFERAQELMEELR